MIQPFPRRILPALVFVLAILAGCRTPLEQQLRNTAKAPADDDSAVAVRWLGASGFEITSGGATLLVDPFLTRPGFCTAAVLDLPLESDQAVIDREIRGASDILVSHSHYDNLMDVPAIAKKTGATVHGSTSTRNVCLGSGVPEHQARVVSNGTRILAGGFEVTVIRSLHEGVFVGTETNTGKVESPPTVVMRASHFKMGEVFGFLIETNGKKIYHHGSANLVEENLRALVKDVDVLLLAVDNWKSVDGYLENMLSITNPKVVIPCRHDDPYSPFAAGVNLSVWGAFNQFLGAVGKLRPDVEVVTLDFFQTYWLAD